jgi:hypothetical protein
MGGGTERKMTIPSSTGGWAYQSLSLGGKIEKGNEQMGKMPEKL